MAKKVLISFVGNQDPVNKRDEDGPLLSLVKNTLAYQKNLKPDLIYLLPTAQREDVKSSTQRKGEETQKKLQALGFSQTYLRPLNVPSAIDYKELNREILASIGKIKDELKDQEVNYYVNLSSGTPQMNDVMLSLVMGNFIKKATLLRPMEKGFLPQLPDGTPDETKLIQEVDIQPLTEDNKIRRSISLFRGCFFDASSDILTEVGAETSVIKRGKACSMLSSLIDAYHRWDLFHYEEALGQIRKIEKNEANRYAEFKILSPLLAKQRLALSTVNDKGIKGRCLDLYHNAHRRFSQGHLADSIWRSYAIYEAILFNRVQSLTGCNPQDFRDTFTALQRSQKLSPETTKKINEFIRENYQGKTPHFLEGEKVKELIQRFDADFWVKTITANQERGLNSFRKKRNKIIHQGKAPDINVAREGLKMTRELIKKTPGSPAQDIDNYPFSVETIQDMAENILPSLLF